MMKKGPKNKIVSAALFFLILVPLYFNQSSSAENENPFITRMEGTITATIAIKKNPMKVWETLTDYKVIGMKMSDIRKVNLLKETTLFEIRDFSPSTSILESPLACVTYLTSFVRCAFSACRGAAACGSESRGRVRT